MLTDAWCIASLEVNTSKKTEFSLKDIIGDGFLWAVPKHRRTLERRHKRKYGSPEYVLKILQPKTNIKTCDTCGDDHEVGVLCRKCNNSFYFYIFFNLKIFFKATCYKKVIDETKAMQEAIQNELKFEPVEKEVVVLYEGEKDGKPDEFWEGKRIVEIKKERPSWFSQNLLQKTTQQPATTSDVKPSQLG